MWLEGAAVSVELNAVAPWVSIAISFATLIFVVITYRSGRSEKRIAEVEGKIDGVAAVADAKASKDHVAILAAKVDVVEDKVTVIENEMKHLPGKETTHRLEIALGEVRSEMRGMIEQVKPLSTMVDRVHEMLLNKMVVKQ